MFYGYFFFRSLALHLTHCFLQFFFLRHFSPTHLPRLSLPLLPQSRTSSPPTISATSPTSSSGRTRWSTTVAGRCFPERAASVRTISAAASSWRTPGPPSWRPDWTAPDQERSPLTTMSFREHFTCLSWSYSTAFSLPTCELHEILQKYNENNGSFPRVLCSQGCKFLRSYGAMFLTSWVSIVLSSVVPKLPRSFFSRAMCSQGPRFQGAMFPGVLCSQSLKFQGSQVSYVPRFLIFPGSCVPRVLSSQPPMFLMFPACYVIRALCHQGTLILVPYIPWMVCYYGPELWGYYVPVF